MSQESKPEKNVKAEANGEPKTDAKPETGGKTEKEKKSEWDSRLVVTRAILNEVREHLGLDKRRWTDQQVLAWAQHMSGREVVLVDEIPEDEEIVLICSPEPYVAGSLKAVCSECGTTVYHSRHAPPNARKICTRCGPRLGH